MTVFIEDEFDRLFRHAIHSLAGAAPVAGRFAEQDDIPEAFCCGYVANIGPDGRQTVKEFGNAPRRALGARKPLVEIIDDANQKLVKMVAEMPGVEKSDIRIRVNGGLVHIDAETGERKFHAAVPIRHRIDTDSAKANYKNGFLEISFRRSEPEKPKGKSIEVQ